MKKILALVCASFFVFAATPSAQADEKQIKKGAKVYKKCKACHAVGPDAKNKVGPILNGIIGKKVASTEGFKYSPAMKAKGDEGMIWTEENLAAFLEKPRDFINGTKMAFAGLRKEKDRVAIIAYFKSLAQ